MATPSRDRTNPELGQAASGGRGGLCQERGGQRGICLLGPRLGFPQLVTDSNELESLTHLAQADDYRGLASQMRVRMREQKKASVSIKRQGGESYTTCIRPGKAHEDMKPDL